jgi:hypothetical protein
VLADDTEGDASDRIDDTRPTSDRLCRARPGTRSILAVPTPADHPSASEAFPALAFAVHQQRSSEADVSEGHEPGVMSAFIRKA